MADPKPAEAPQAPIYDDDLQPKPETTVDVAVPEGAGEEDAPPGPSSRPVPAKDPETGKFVKAPHPQSLLRRANDLGIPQEDCEGYSSSQLEDVVYHAERTLIRERQREARFESREAPSHFEEHVHHPEPPKEEDEFGMAENGLPLAEALDPALTKYLKSLKAELAAVKGQLAELMRAEQHRSNTQTFDAIDRAFADLGPAFEGAFGKGARADLDPAGAEMAKRSAVLAMVAQQRTQDGKPIPKSKIPQAVKEIAKKLFGDAAKSPPPVRDSRTGPEWWNGRDRDPALAERRQEWEEGTTARPTHRVTEEPQEGTQAATDYVADWINQQRGQKPRQTSDNGNGIYG